MRSPIFSLSLTDRRKQYGSKTVLVVYGEAGERHELAVLNGGRASLLEGVGVTAGVRNGATILNWQTTTDRKVVRVHGDLFIYLLGELQHVISYLFELTTHSDRNSAYDYWVLNLPVDRASTDSSTSAVIVKAGYLLRTAQVSGNTLALTGDLDATTIVEVVGAPSQVSRLTFNNKTLECSYHGHGIVSGTVTYVAPNFTLPTLNNWSYIDSLPEIRPSYSDSTWTEADHTTTNNTIRNLTTPTSLYSSDYGYHTGTLLYRGHFTATGVESTIYLLTQGGSAFGMSSWLNDTFIGSWDGIDAASNASTMFTLPNLERGKPYVLTVVIDNMGLNEDFQVGSEQMKLPRGILDYDISGRVKSDVIWRLTGNLGGEDYRDHVRGPLNEGGMYAERQGYHLPTPPVNNWMKSAGPTAGITSAGIGFFVTSFELDMPAGYDIPLSIVFTNSSGAHSSADYKTSIGTGAPAYRVQLYVNGYQFGKYVHNIGPQKSFPVPEGIFNYHGTNWVAMSLWSLDPDGARVENVQLVARAIIQSGYGDVALSPMSDWTLREDAY